ncbi:MAG: SAF domain-containing protein, partial [Propionibacteriaceae bacterium]
MALRSTPTRSAALTPPLRPPTKARRRPVLLIIGVLAICLGALGSTALYSSLSHSHQILRVARAVEPGQVVSSADLSIVSLPSISGIDVVPASALADVVGKPAAHELRAGTLL